MKSVLGGARINGGEPLGRAGALVAADAEGNHVAVAELDGQVEDGLRLLGSKLADGVEDPQERDAEICFAALAAAFEAFEEGGEILLAPKADADGDDHLGVQNVLRFQPLHQAVGDELVVFGSAEVSGDVLERGEESGEVARSCRVARPRRGARLPCCGAGGVRGASPVRSSLRGAGGVRPSGVSG